MNKAQRFLAGVGLAAMALLVMAAVTGGPSSGGGGAGGNATNAIFKIQGNTNQEHWTLTGTNGNAPNVVGTTGGFSSTNTVHIPYAGPARHGQLNSNDFNIIIAALRQMRLSSNGVLVGSQTNVNIIYGTNMVITATNNTTTGSVDLYISSTGGGAGVSDGDKGDITASSSGSVWTIDNAVVTLAKMANLSAPSKLIGRFGAGAGVPQEITISTGLSLDGSGNLTASASATAFDAIGDPSGNGNVLFGNTFQLFSSTLDTSGGRVLRLHDTDASLANSVSLLTLDFDDGPHSGNGVYLELRNDPNGANITDYSFAANLMKVNVAANLSVSLAAAQATVTNGITVRGLTNAPGSISLLDTNHTLGVTITAGSVMASNLVFRPPTNGPSSTLTNLTGVYLADGSVQWIWTGDNAASPASGDALLVNATAITDSASLTNTPGSTTITPTTWSVVSGTDPDPDKVTVAIGNASTTAAGAVSASGSQEFAGSKGWTGESAWTGPMIQPPAKTITGTLTVTGTNAYTMETSTNFNFAFSGASSNGQRIKFAVRNTNTTTTVFGTNATAFYRESIGALATTLEFRPTNLTTLVFDYYTNFSNLGNVWVLALEGGFAHPIEAGVNTALDTNATTGAISIRASTTISTNGTSLAAGVTNFNFNAGVTGVLSGATAILGVVPLGVYRTIYIPAGSMITNLTGGAIWKTEETATNKKMRDYLEFDGTSTNSVTVGFRMPQEWNLGTVKVKFDWSSTNSAATQTNVWEIAAGAVSDDDPVDGSFGTAVTIDDVVTAANDQLLSAATAAVTVGGTPVAEDFVDWRVRRLPGHALDNMTGVAKLYGVFIQYLERSNATTSW